MKYKNQILFVGVFATILYAAFHDSHDKAINVKRGLLAGAFVMIAQGTLKQYNGLFVKGYEWFWRAIQRAILCYICVLLFILFQNTNDARSMMGLLDDSLGKPINKDMHTYDDNCEFEVSNLVDNMDHYFLIHLINWFCAALIVRDYYLLHFWSILDEIIELSWQHILPHFRECWWDHVIMDVLMTNTVAIIIGVELTKLLGLKQFDWLGRKGKKSIFEWDFWKCHRRFGGVCYMFVVIISNFLTGFFMISALWIPPVNIMNVFRLLLWFLLAAISFGELYDDIETWGTEKRRENPIPAENRWLCCAVALIEVLISWKFRVGAGNHIDAETPLYISVPWGISVAFCLFMYFKLRFGSKVTSKYGDSAWEIAKRREIEGPAAEAKKVK